jgi:hypothetical protein
MPSVGPPLLGPRSALIIFIAIFIGLGAGALVRHDGASLAKSVFIGIGAAAGALGPVSWIMD